MSQLLCDLNNPFKKVEENPDYVQINLNKNNYKKVVDFINKNYKINNALGVFTEDNLLVFLLREVKMLKKIDSPYYKYVHANYITKDLEFTSLGIEFIINLLLHYGKIS